MGFLRAHSTRVPLVVEFVRELQVTEGSCGGEGGGKRGRGEGRGGGGREEGEGRGGGGGREEGGGRGRDIEMS